MIIAHLRCESLLCNVDDNVHDDDADDVHNDDDVHVDDGKNIYDNLCLYYDIRYIKNNQKKRARREAHFFSFFDFFFNSIMFYIYIFLFMYCYFYYRIDNSRYRHNALRIAWPYHSHQTC